MANGRALSNNRYSPRSPHASWTTGHDAVQKTMNPAAIVLYHTPENWSVQVHFSLIFSMLNHFHSLKLHYMKYFFIHNHVLQGFLN